MKKAEERLHKLRIELMLLLSNIDLYIIFHLPAHRWWALQYQPLCWHESWTTTASAPVPSPGCTADTDSCLWARWRGRSCGLHPPTPPPPASPHSEPGQLSPGGESEGGRLYSGSAVLGDAASAEGKAAEPERVRVHGVSSEPGRRLHTHSSARPPRRNVKIHSTFLLPSMRTGLSFAPEGKKRE